MPANNQIESVLLDPLQLPYNNILNELDRTPRLVTGSQNTLITFGGALSSRGGTRAMSNGSLTGRIVRLWSYETLEASPRTYLLASVYTGSAYTMYYNAVDAGVLSGWTQMTALGDLRASTRAHEVVVVRGRAYIKGYPNGAGSDKLGMYQWYATGGTVVTTYWGLLGPTAPATLKGSARRLNGAINESQTAITVSSTAIGAALPATPFVVQCEFEQMNVTSIGGGTNWTVTRGYNGTTSASHIDGSMLVYRNWSASTHNTQASIGWKYSYCWKNLAGHYSNRAPLQTNYDQMPSFSGPVNKLIPKFTVTAPSDTTNYPSVLILRTTDGGGTLYPLTEIDNTATSIDFEDKYFPTGTGLASNVIYDGPIYNRTIPAGSFVDPVEDEYLIGDQQGPGLDTNSPLPTVLAPLVTGTDAPSTFTSSLVYHMGRIWLAIGNVLFFTSAEELPIGIPEEASDTSSAGNFYRFQDNIAQIYSMGDRLYIFTVTGRVLELTGVSKETFTVLPVAEGIGAPTGHPHAICRANDKLFVLSRDYHLYMMDTDSRRIISHPLTTELISKAQAGAEIQLSYFTDNEKSWLVVGAYDRATPTNSRVWVCDLYKTQRLSRNYSDNIERSSQDLPEKVYDFWNAPWTIRASAQLVGRWTRADNSQRLYFSAYDGTTSQIVYYDATYQADDLPGGSFVEYDWRAYTNLMQTPSGNLINQIRQPNVHPAAYAITLERSQTANDQDPGVSVFIDDLWTSPIPVKLVKDQYTKDSRGFRIVQGHINREGKYFALQFRQDALSFSIKIHKFHMAFDANYSTN